MVDGRPIPPSIAAELITRLRRVIDGVSFAFELGLIFAREEVYPVRAPDPSYRPDVSVDECIGDALDLAAAPVHKLIVGHPRLDFDRLLHGVTAAIGDRAEVTYSAREFVEVSARGVTKASGVKALAERLSVDVRDVVAIGDMPNDLAMLDWAGRGVAVANAHSDVVAAADIVVAANDDDGVAVLLEGLAAGG
jgi:hydroxymethylpyrimidine pyrophosphatase-like HAD family hydrolase